MAAQLAIQADVVDLRTDTPKPGDMFLVDTNVWFWMSYSRATQTARPYQVKDYPDFVVRVWSSGARLFCCNLTFAELTSVIEATEWDIHKRLNNSNANLPKKEYRHNYPALRQNVVNEIQSAWGIVSSLAEPLDAVIDTPTTNSALARLSISQVDGYDLFILEAMKTHAITQLISDDGDFATVPGIQVFTANINVLTLARSQGKLVTR